MKSDTSELTINPLIINNSCAEKSATVDANNSEDRAIDKVQKSDSDEGDFEIISKEHIPEMADAPNGMENAETQREDAEANDQFPQQVSNTKNSNWNSTELAEKRKRLR